MDKEPDGVVVYANGDSCNPIQENVSVLPPLDSVPRDDDEATANTELQYAEENIEVKEYDVKECTSEIPVGKPSEEDDDIEIAGGSKTVHKSALPAKHGSKTGRGSNKIRNTVPQPFALATEKRASSATRLFAGESHEVVAAVSKVFPDGYSKVQNHATKVRFVWCFIRIFTLLESQLLMSNRIIATFRYLGNHCSQRTRSFLMRKILALLLLSMFPSLKSLFVWFPETCVVISSLALLLTALHRLQSLLNQELLSP